ncbi:MAG TPA: LPS-assembly protein LptD [Xanthobacteraceae bacterium]|jgi:LPS-assembly protein|nr:LPS-assembly protein LptD [Xanthobacteraceae bacterium]
MASSTTARFRYGRWRAALWAATASAVAVAWTLAPRSAAAQATDFLTFQQQLRPQPPKRGPGRTDQKGQPQMLVQANELDYDYTNDRVSAVGNVQIYYNGATLEADKVIYDQKTKRLHAEGNARLTEADGKVTYGEIIDLSEDYRDGFIDSLRLETPDQTRLAAASAQRTSGNYTVFQSGVYTACQPCKDDPKKPPLWQVKAARIIHNQGEKMIYFESASLEFFGMPIAYFPYFSTPDPTVKRKSGFLMPAFSSSSIYGYSAEIPYYFALAPNYDLTFTPRFTTTQGPLLQAEWRQRFETGSFMIRGSGIDQLDKSIFKLSDGSTSPGYRNWRGSLETTGQFNLSQRWVWGWDALLLSDRTYLQDYNLGTFQNLNPFGATVAEGVSQAYLSGRGDRSYFDARAIHYLGFSVVDNQRALPIIHPVTDYTYVFGSPILGGELGYDVNLTSLSRQAASFDPISQTAVNNNLCAPNTADPAVKIPANCLLRGVPGTYTRFTAETHWRRQIVDSFGQVFTPFASVRVDAASLSVDSDPGVANYIEPGDTDLVRAMPTVGFEYRYPFIGTESWGTQTIEPIAQVIVRPNEPDIGKFPNEDAQSLVFDDSNLFRVDKFSGYDRVEGGGRANAGVQYTAQFNRGGFANVLFGQSYQLFGTNSFAVGDTANTGLGSGLDKPVSDYVARVSYQPNKIYTFTSRYRFDQETFSLNRLEVEGRANYDRWSVSLLYGNYAAQPELGFLNRREGVLGSSSVKLNANWVLSGAARYDIEAGKFDQTRVGLGYIDDCFIMGLNYITSYTYYTFDTGTNTFSTVPQTDHRVMLQMSLRTLGGTGNSGFGGY